MQRLPVMLYHGNQDAAMIPVFGQGKSNNDYGQGFYTTPDKELGKEWAYSGFTKGECGYLHSNYLDKYFSYADSFVRMELYSESLDKALRLGNLGLQVFF